MSFTLLFPGDQGIELRRQVPYRLAAPPRTPEIGLLTGALGPTPAIGAFVCAPRDLSSPNLRAIGTDAGMSAIQIDERFQQLALRGLEVTA